jgi:hypothetical protein
MGEDREKRKKDSRLVRKLKASGGPFFASLALSITGPKVIYEEFQSGDVGMGIAYTALLGASITLTTLMGIFEYRTTN